MSWELQSLLPYPNSCLGTSPHQQGRDTKMLSFCGIDVSKDRLDVMVLPEEQCCSVPNDASGWAALVARLRNFSIMAIGLEASGGYVRGVARALLAAGMSVRQVNPFKLRQVTKLETAAKKAKLDAANSATAVKEANNRAAKLDALAKKARREATGREAAAAPVSYTHLTLPTTERV